MFVGPLRVTLLVGVQTGMFAESRSKYLNSRLCPPGAKIQKSLYIADSRGKFVSPRKLGSSEELLGISKFAISQASSSRLQKKRGLSLRVIGKNNFRQLYKIPSSSSAFFLIHPKSPTLASPKVLLA